MHSILWASVGVSAGVAIITSVLIDFIFKPGLETRKDRIVEAKREKREALKAVRLALSLSERLLAYKDTVPDNIPTEYMRTISEEFSERIETAFDALVTPESLDNNFSRIAAIFHTFAFAVQVGKPPEESWKALQSATEELDICYYYLKAPRWRLLLNRTLIKDITSYPHYEDTEPPLEDDEETHSLPDQGEAV